MKKRRFQYTSPLLKKLNLLKLDDICNLNCLMYVYKTVNDIIPSPISFEPRLAGRYNLRRAQPLLVPRAASRQSQRFLRIKGAQLWNALPPELRAVNTIISFKIKLKRNFINQYE